MKVISIITLTAVLLFNTSCKHQKHEEAEAPKFLVTSPVLKDTVLYKEYVCQIRSIQHIEVRTMEKGYLQNIYVDEGQLVKQGQLMFRIMPIIYTAEMQKAEAEVNFAEIEYQNTANLANKNIVSTSELALAKAKLNLAKGDLALAKAHLEFTEIRAPFSGIMDRFHVRLGSLLSEGELITTLSDNSKMWVYFNVPEAEYLDFEKNKNDSLLKVKLVMANNQPFDHMGVVETIEADFNNETGNIAFRATFPNPKGLLRHGETGNILMPVVLKKVLLIPQKATFEILDKKFVYVLDEHSIIHSKQITVGTELPHFYAVTEGLKESDKILLEGLRKVKNNQKINFIFKNQETVLSELQHLYAE